jgi:tRNA(Ile2) C34 agmatinyltransferase TiaS
MGSATSWNLPGRRHIVRLCGPGESVIVAGGLNEAAANRVAEAINAFFGQVLNRPPTATCDQCPRAMASSGS